MAQFALQPKIKANIAVVLSEEEARALDALVGYGADSFLKVFYTHLGRHYLEPHEKGLRALFESVRLVLPGQLAQVDAARKVMEGQETQS